MSKQQFKRGWRVKVSDKMPPIMSHFEKGFEAIIEYSFHQQYGYGAKNDYRLIQLKNGKPVNSISWYPASLLILVSDDQEAGKKLIENFNYSD